MELKYMEVNDKAFVMSIDTHVNEAQYANRVLTKSGYVDCGGLLMNGTPFEQPMEMFMRKVL